MHGAGNLTILKAIPLITQKRDRSDAPLITYGVK